MSIDSFKDCLFSCTVKSNIVVTPPKSEIAKVYNKAEKEKKKDFWKIFWEDYELDELAEDNWPAEDITIGIEKNYNPDLVVTYSAKKAEIEKPTYIKHYKIKSKIWYLN